MMLLAKLRDAALLLIGKITTPAGEIRCDTR
jgi:hypothetical protein